MVSKPAKCQYSCNERQLDIILILLCLVPIVLSFFLSTDGNHCTLHILWFSIIDTNRCAFKSLTGFNCPVCGMTRCFTYMTHGALLSAWKISHAGVVLYLFCIYEIVYRFLCFLHAHKMIIRILHVCEFVFLVIVCFSVAFCFVIQFIYPSILH